MEKTGMAGFHLGRTEPCQAARGSFAGTGPTAGQDGGAQETLGTVLGKAHFWERFAKEPLNERQIKVLNSLLDGFEGNLSTSKWAKLAKCSQETAYRDILDLVKREALKKDPGGGRSTRYSLLIE